MSGKLTDKCAECGHDRQQHIYNEGACRPGFVCPSGCTGFKEEYGPCPTCKRVQKYDHVALGYSCQGSCEQASELADTRRAGRGDGMSGSPKLARIYFVGNPHGLDTDETFTQVSSRLDQAAWQPDGGVSQGFPRTFDTEVNGSPVTVNALLVTHVAEYERTCFR